MDKLIKHSILWLFILFSLACQSQLPKNAPNDLEINFENSVLNEDGSPAGFFRSMTVSGKQMKVELMRCRKVENITLEDSDINALYQAFVRSEFDLINHWC